MGLSEILLNNLLGTSESQAQMVVPHGTVSVTVLVTLLVIPVPRDSSALRCLALLTCSLLSQAYFGLGCQLCPVSVNPGLDPLLQKSLAWSWTCSGGDC